MTQGYARRAVEKANRDGFGALADSTKRCSHHELHRRTLSRWIALRLVRSEDADVRLLGRALSRTLSGEFSRHERSHLAAIDDARVTLDESDETIRSWDRERRLDDLAKCPPHTGRLLFSFVRTLRPERVLELGTCVGTSAAYQTAALELNDAGRITTLEADPARIAVARGLLDGLGLNRVSIAEGRFRDTLSDVLDRSRAIDMVFIDGHHEEDATVEYFDAIATSLRDGAVVVSDDVDWSDGMARAWRRISQHDRFDAVLTVDGLGVGIAGGARRGGESRRVFV
jgi:predicted O-methyltransferase YrrM